MDDDGLEAAATSAAARAALPPLSRFSAASPAKPRSARTGELATAALAGDLELVVSLLDGGASVGEIDRVSGAACCAGGGGCGTEMAALFCRNIGIELPSSEASFLRNGAISIACLLPLDALASI